MELSWKNWRKEDNQNGKKKEYKCGAGAVGKKYSFLGMFEVHGEKKKGEKKKKLIS